ncbi:hypothetical protein CsSME_00027248 [Camellia sinensis var. sinensis]
MARSMNPELYRATIIGDIDRFIRALEDRENCLVIVTQVSPQGNTVLHIAAGLGHDQLIEFILRSNRDLVKVKNSKGDLVFHFSVSAGHLSTINLLASSLRQNEFMDFEGKSPLYMAAEAGWADLVKLMMGTKLVAIGSDYVNDRINGKSLVHAAFTGKSREVLDIVLSKNSVLIHSIDEEGRSPLSHAASIGYYNGVSYSLDKFIQGTYQRNQNDSSELLNKQGQNTVHVAAKNGKDNVIKYVLKTPELEKFINERDEKGNTPLHLATMHWRPMIVNLLTWDKRVRLELVNDAGLTALDVAEKYIGTAPPFRKRLTWMALKSAGAPRSKRQKPNRQFKEMGENYKERINTLMLVLTIIATVTVTAGFTVPGGYKSSAPDEGTTTLLNSNYFKAF